MTTSQKLADLEYEEQRITEVQAGIDGGWAIGMDHMWFHVPAASPVSPVVGMVARMYGQGFGSSVRGLDLDGHEVFYRTAAEDKAYHEAKYQKKLDEDRASIEAEWPALQARVAALPEPLRARFDLFPRHADDWWPRFGRYELFTCEQAVVFVGALKSVDELERWRELSPTEQRAAVPGMDDGHSGNTFGGACMLARFLLTDPPLAYQAHGALTPLVGCAEYGCIHPRSLEVLS